MTNRVKVAVTGAAGQIGYALLFRLASGAVFGDDVTVDLHLLEVPQAVHALDGVIMELQDCAFPTLGQVIATDDVNVAMKDVNWAVLVGAMPRKDGMERSDLLKINGQIFTGQGKAINDHAARDVKVIVVGNPCNTNCLIAMNHAPDIPREQFFAMTMLDQNRACAQLALKANVEVTEVDKMVIWGNHSATQFPDFYNATINGTPAVDHVTDFTWFEDDFIPTVQKRGAAVIKARGASSAASAANGIVDSMKALYFDTPEGAYYSMCCCAPGDAYGVEQGLIYSFPCRTDQGRVSIVRDIPHNDEAISRLTTTLNELKTERDAVTELGLIGA